MDNLKFKSIVIVFILFSTGCSKVQYIFEQGLGQASLFMNARENNKVLEDPFIPDKTKEKIKKIKNYKAFFYKYFNKKERDHYKKTTLLKNDAVTYLITASPFDRINPKKECFPIVGCFPYLGFFDKESAKEHRRNLEKKGWVTWLRPVYAYSTLGNFNDPILSSFFRYDDEVLAELIFHELFHTIYFVKNEVQLNENLANFFAGELIPMYFSWGPERERKRRKNRENFKSLEREVVGLVKDLQTRYEKVNGSSRLIYQKTLASFLKDKFFPHIRSFCHKKKIPLKKCYPLNRKWNNASFAGFLTYEEEAIKIEKLKKVLQLNLLEFLKYLEQKGKEYEKIVDKKGFSTFLFNPLD